MYSVRNASTSRWISPGVDVSFGAALNAEALVERGAIHALDEAIVRGDRTFVAQPAADRDHRRLHNLFDSCGDRNPKSGGAPPCVRTCSTTTVETIRNRAGSSINRSRQGGTIAPQADRLASDELRLCG